ncbi:T9SS type A sorting domain-containing protein [Flavobacterium sp. XGLA_31]|uniref:T9SS type A sorting domain-containing protein n=1 Tax=Flavobacterium sp. XGLA_31 TaxID=3447666 RepID=UPI003F3CAD90
MKQILTLVLFFFVFNMMQAQNTYLCKMDNRIYRLNSDSSLTSIIALDNTPSYIEDIALSPSNIFYAIIDFNKIIAINGNNNFTILTSLPADGLYNSLTCSNNYELYTISNAGENSKLYKYNILTNTTELVTTLGFATPGDLTFYKGNLIFAADGTNKIKAYNLENNTLTDIFCLPQQYAAIFGIAGIYTSCDSTVIRCCTQTAVLELNLSNNTVTDLQVASSVFFGMTSDNEFLSSECSFQFETASCALSNPDYSQDAAYTVFPNPFFETIHLKNNEEINSLEIFDINGRLILKISSPGSEINLSNLEKGVYFFKTYTERGYKLNKILKS